VVAGPAGSCTTAASALNGPYGHSDDTQSPQVFGLMFENSS
jgi:hypothetical protein